MTELNIFDNKEIGVYVSPEAFIAKKPVLQKAALHWLRVEKIFYIAC